MARWKKYSLISILSLIALLLLSMLVVPWQIKKQGSAWIAENTSRQLHFGKVFFNPFTLTVELEATRLTEQNSEETFVGLQRLMVSASVRSLFELALILDRVELDGLYLNVERRTQQEFNFSDFTRLGDGQPAEAPKEPGRPFLFSFNNIVLNNCSVDFIDLASPQVSRHRIRELNLSVPFVGNIPYLTDEYVEPHLSLLLNGSEIRAEGQLKPFHETVETTLSLVLNDIDLAFYARNSPVPLPVEMASGTLDTQIDLTYRISSQDHPKLFLGGELALTDIDIRDGRQQELFRMPTLILDLDWADLMQQDFTLSSLEIYEPQIYVDRDSQGVWNFQRLLPASEETPPSGDQAEQATAEASSLPLVKVDSLILKQGQVHFRDDFVPGGVVEEVSDINLSLSGLSTLREAATELQLALRTDHSVSSELDGELTLNPPSARLNLLVNGIPLQPYYPYLAEILTQPVMGNLNLASAIEYTRSGNLLLSQAQLSLHDLQVPFIEEDRFLLNDLMLSGVSLDLQQRQLSLGNIRLRNGSLQASRLADGSLTPLKLIKEQAAAEQPAGQNSETSPPWRLSVGQFNLAGIDLLWKDVSLPRQPELKIDQLALEIDNLNYPESTQSPISLNGKLGKRGSFAVTGKIAHTPLRVQAETRLKALPLPAFNRFIPADLNFYLEDGRLDTTLAVKLSETPGQFIGTFAGRLSLSNFHLRDPLSQGELLAWESLGLEGIKGEVGPFALQIEQVALSNYRANILIDSQGQVNLTSLTTGQQATESTAESQAAAPQPNQETAESTPAPDIRIAALTLQGGTVSFQDRHLPSTFATTMYELGGRISGMASDPEMEADVDLRGRLENHSPLTISGKLNPLSKDLFADLTIRFEDIDLVPMTPYSGTYLGYAIDKGKLHLDLNYHIAHRHIDAENRIMIDQFTFGDSIKSDQATALPVTLAVALLKDSSGEIHLDVPVSGNLDDPSFSVAGTIFTVLKNLLVKAATSPFSLLTSMFGGEEDFSSVTFASGLSRLPESEREKLPKLAGMLAQRPSLTLEVSGFADPEQDPEAYRQEQLRQRLLEVKRRQMEDSGQPPAAEQPLEISPEEYPELLTEVYRNADFPRPRNFVGMLKELPVEEMEKLLLANIQVDDEVLAGLARQRALHVREALVADQEQISGQIFLKPTDIFQPPKSGPASRVEFGIASK